VNPAVQVTTYMPGVGPEPQAPARQLHAGTAGAAPASSDTEVVHAARMVERDVLLVLTETHNAAWVLRHSNRVTDRS
jgi:hypothetical protein